MIIDSRNYIRLQILSSLLAPKSQKVCIQKGDKKNKIQAKFWKPNVTESAQGLCIHVKVQIQNLCVYSYFCYINNIFLGTR